MFQNILEFPSTIQAIFRTFRLCLNHSLVIFQKISKTKICRFCFTRNFFWISSKKKSNLPSTPLRRRCIFWQKCILLCGGGGGGGGDALSTRFLKWALKINFYAIYINCQRRASHSRALRTKKLKCRRPCRALCAVPSQTTKNSRVQNVGCGGGGAAWATFICT